MQSSFTPQALLDFSVDLQELVGSETFEQSCLLLLRNCGLLPVGVAHAMRYHPATKRSVITDENGTVEQSGGPIERVIDTFSTELPAFKAAVETAEHPAVLSKYQSCAEIEQSTIWNAVIRPFGMADVLNLPLMQAETRHSIIVASPRQFEDRDLELADLLRRYIIAAMRNHYWLKHAEANGKHIEEVKGKSIILEMTEDGSFPDWGKAADLFANGNTLGFLSFPPPKLVEWFNIHIAQFPLQSTDLNRAEFQLGKNNDINIHAAFLGNRDGHHRLLLYLPSGVPDGFGLTKREIDVLSWVCHGYGNKDIATVLGISHHTVRRHVEKIFQKLHVTTRTEAGSIARGWFED